jgi:hypothetical protein
MANAASLYRQYLIAVRNGGTGCRARAWRRYEEARGALSLGAQSDMVANQHLYERIHGVPEVSAPVAFGVRGDQS